MGLWRRLGAQKGSKAPEEKAPGSLQELENPYHRLYTRQRTLEELARSAREVQKQQPPAAGQEKKQKP